MAPPRIRTACILLPAILAAAPLAAQRPGDVPRRPRLAADADSNDARAYFRLGQDLLVRRPADAADAFYWAAQIEPGWADPLYGRHVALLMSHPQRLVLYNQMDRRTRRHPEVLRIDSLYYRALWRDPFLRRQFDRELVRQYVIAVLTEPYGGSSDGGLANFYSERVLRDLPPLLRGRVLAGEGRIQQALQAYDEALRQRRGPRSEPLRTLHHERGRLFALAGNDSMALEELGRAVDAGEEAERDDLVWLYQNKALLEHGRGMLHERRGDRAAAREAYARALLEDLSYDPAHLRLAALALVEGDTATALTELRLAAEAGTGEPATRLAYAALLARLQQLPEAEAELLAITRLAPYYAEPWFLLGMVRDWSGDPGAAAAYRAFLDRARRDDPRRAQVEPLAAPPSP